VRTAEQRAAASSGVWQRVVLYAAGAYNGIGGLSALVDPSMHFTTMYTWALSLEDPLQVFFFRVTWVNAIAWGVAYLLAARLPAARTPVLVAGSVGKVAYCGVCIALFRTGVGSALLLATGAIDVLFAALFLVILVRTPESRA
jgi:hypothetical protein